MSQNINIPNSITSLRVVGTFFLLFLMPLSPEFFVVYLLTGITDVLDGFIARKTKTVSEFGSKLDSIADLFFYFVMIIKILPLLIHALPHHIWYAVAAILLLRIISYVTAAVKYHRFASLHTILNKLTGFVIFSVPFAMHFSCTTPICVLACIISGIASAEELIIHISYCQYRSDTKTLFSNAKDSLKNG